MLMTCVHALLGFLVHLEPLKPIHELLKPEVATLRTSPDERGHDCDCAFGDTDISHRKLHCCLDVVGAALWVAGNRHREVVVVVLADEPYTERS